MAEEGSFGFDPEDLERLVRGAGEQLRGAFPQLGSLFENSGQQPGWSTLFDGARRRPAGAPEKETTGETGAGVWMIYSVNADGGAQVEQVYATELDALRANKHNTDSNRNVRFLPYGIPITVLDATEETPDS